MHPDNIDQYDDVQDELDKRGLRDECRDAFASVPEHGETDWAADLFDAWAESKVLGDFDRRIESWVRNWLDKQEERQVL